MLLLLKSILVPSRAKRSDGVFGKMPFFIKLWHVPDFYRTQNECETLLDTIFWEYINLGNMAKNSDFELRWNLQKFYTVLEADNSRE